MIYIILTPTPQLFVITLLWYLPSREAVITFLLTFGVTPWPSTTFYAIVRDLVRILYNHNIDIVIILYAKQTDIKFPYEETQFFAWKTLNSKKYVSVPLFRKEITLPAIGIWYYASHKM